MKNKIIFANHPSIKGAIRKSRRSRIEKILGELGEIVRKSDKSPPDLTVKQVPYNIYAAVISIPNPQDCRLRITLNGNVSMNPTCDLYEKFGETT